MRVISQDGAIATLAFIPDEVRPLKGYHLQLLIDAVGSRYNASKLPTLEEARTTGARFENGLFFVGDRTIPIPLFYVHNDGISVTTSDTADSDSVVDDMFAWLKQTFEFREPTTPAIRIYQSDLVVRFDNDPAAAFDKLAPFIKLIQEEMTPANAASKKDVQFHAIGFGGDPTAPGATPGFSVMRRDGVPWRLGLYFSKANMRTDAHIRALEFLDTLIAAKS
jgi:hypothetical protein